MNKKVKKIVASGIFSVMTLGAIGCGSANSALAKNIDKGMADFVKSINNLDYVDTKTSQNGYGKIVETAATIENEDNTALLNEKIDNLEIENTITKPSERNDNFKLYVLSESPYITLMSNDNDSSIEINAVFSTEKIENRSENISTQINELILKRSILMIYVNELYNGNVNISEENKTAINAYVNVIKENASYLNGNRGMVRNQLRLANDLISERKNNNLVNYYMIKSGEALETRSNKIESTISAIDSIISILENNLKPTSAYYQTKLSSTYEKIVGDLKPTQTGNENQEIASNIASSLDFKFTKTNQVTNNAENTENEKENQVTNNRISTRNQIDESNTQLRTSQTAKSNTQVQNNEAERTKTLSGTQTAQKNETQTDDEKAKTETTNTIRSLKYEKPTGENKTAQNQSVNSENTGRQTRISRVQRQNSRRNHTVKSVNGEPENNIENRSNETAKTSTQIENKNTNKSYEEITMKADRTNMNRNNNATRHNHHQMRNETQNVVRVPYEITNQD